MQLPPKAEHSSKKGGAQGFGTDRTTLSVPVGGRDLKGHERHLMCFLAHSAGGKKELSVSTARK